jgi:predicted metalloprotease
LPRGCRNKAGGARRRKKAAHKGGARAARLLVVVVIVVVVVVVLFNMQRGRTPILDDAFNVVPFAFVPRLNPPR